MKVTIEGSEIVIRMPLAKPSASNVSKSGKTHVIAGSAGFIKTDVIEPNTKKPISIGVNVTIPA